MLKNSVALTLFVSLLACAPASESPSGSSDGPLKVVATTSIVADLVTQIGAESVEVASLMGAGIDPHLYTPTAGDVRRMAEARVIFYNGLHLEGKMAEVLDEMDRQNVETIPVAECVAPDGHLIAEESQGVVDPHVWFDVMLWKTAAKCTGESLARIDPTRAESYRERTLSYIAELDALEVEIREQIARLEPPQRVLVTAHDAFAYFGRAYGFEVRGLLGVSTASEAGTADVQNLADFIVEREIPAVFVESSVSPRYVEALQEAVRSRGHELAIGGSLFSDALGDIGTPEGTYIGTVRFNVRTIVDALGAS